MMAPFQGFLDLVCTVPGISTITADVIVAETGADMSRFPTAKHLASWAGTTPGNNESAGKVKSSRSRPGNPYLQGALSAAAMACAQNPRTHYGYDDPGGDYFTRLNPGRAKKQAIHQLEAMGYHVTLEDAS
jgi:transposase